MNRNTVIVLVVALLVVGGIVLVRGNSINQPAENTQVTNPTEAPATETDGAMEKEDTGETEDGVENEVITLTADGFEPSSVSIDVGEKVVWENKSGGNATVDSDNHPTHQLYTFLNLGSFPDGGTHELVFDKKGTYTYHDHFNPGKKGTVVVE